MAQHAQVSSGIKVSVLSYQDRIRQALDAGRAGLRKRLEAKHEAQRNDPVHQQRLKEREEQKRKRAEEAEACKQARKKALKLEEQRLKEIEEDRLEEAMRLERRRREKIQERLRREKEVLQARERERCLRLQQGRHERILKREQENELQRATAEEQTKKLDPKKRKQAWQRFLLALTCDMPEDTSHHQVMQRKMTDNTKKEAMHGKCDDAQPGTESSDSEGSHSPLRAQATKKVSDITPDIVELARPCPDMGVLVKFGERLRDPAVREQATHFIESVLHEIQAAAVPSKETQGITLGSDGALDDATDRTMRSAAAKALENAVNNVSHSGYRSRIRDLVAALRRAPNAGPEARQLLQDIIHGDPDAAIQFASLHPEALLNASELAKREAIERAALRAATIRLEDEGLPLKVGEELACPSCGSVSPTLQMVGFKREVENILHGTHGGVGARRFLARCEQCLYSWFHTEGHG